MSSWRAAVVGGPSRGAGLPRRHGFSRVARQASAVLVGAAVIVGAGCRGTAPAPVSSAAWERGIIALERPLPDDLAALYRLRSGNSGWLRLSVLTRDGAGRMTVSGGFGGALSLLAWDGPRTASIFDLKHGCRIAVRDASALLGLSRLPLPQAVRLLAGRLPIPREGGLAALGGGRYRIEGEGWSCRVRLAADPWRVIRVEGPAGTEPPRWKVEIGAHTGSLPGRLEIETSAGRRIVLELVRLEWSSAPELPPLPDLPLCKQR